MNISSTFTNYSQKKQIKGLYFISDFYYLEDCFDFAGKEYLSAMS